MTKDEYLITDPPLKALTVFAMPMILGSFFQQVYNMCRTYECFYLHSTRCRRRGRCTGQPLFWRPELRQDENNRFYFVNQFFAFKHISRYFRFLQCALDDAHTANTC